jgi:steroid delta-isomerase-like uncharacterized protein
MEERSMRTIHGVLSFGILAAACGGGGDEQPPAQPPPAPTVAMATPPPADTTPPKPQEAAKPSPLDMARAGLQAFIDATNAHDAAKAAAGYGDDSVFRSAGMPDTKGKDAIQKALGAWYAAFPNLKFGCGRAWAKGDVAIAECSWAGTNTGDFMGMKTGKDAGTTSLAIVWSAPDGKIKEQHLYDDAGTIVNQLGLAPKGTPKPRAVPTIPSSTEWHVAKGTPDEDKNGDPLKAMYAAFDKGPKGEADFVAPLADSVEWDDLAMPATMKGKDDGKKFFKSWTAAFPDSKGTVTNSWGVEDYVIVEATWTGTHKGAFMGIKPTNKSINVHLVDVAQVKDGKIVKGWTYSNAAEMLMQLGVIKPPGGGDAKKAAGGGDAKAAPATAAPAAPKK